MPCASINRVGYHDYEGLTDSFDERERIVAALGRNRALVMRHHGITTVGDTAREAFSLMKEFVRAARIQLMMEATGAAVLEIPPESASTSRRSMNSTTGGGHRLSGPRIFACSTASIAAIATDRARPRRMRRVRREPALGPAHRAAGADAGGRRRSAPTCAPSRRIRACSPSCWAACARLRQTAEELAEDVVAWGANGFGMWAIRECGHGFVGVTGLEQRPDGRGIALRFALWPEAQGRGLAREAAGAALRFGHEQARLPRIVAVARENNFASRMVLGGIGMAECDSFIQSGYRMVMYESLA